MTSWFLKKEEETHDTRALVASKLAILAPPKHKTPKKKKKKKKPYNSGAKPIFFSFIAIVHIYLWMCTVA